MSDILHRVASVHAGRRQKIETVKRRKQIKLERQRAYFKDTGILDMWEDIKDIQIPNHIPERFSGTLIAFKDLVVPTEEPNTDGTGLILYDKKDAIAQWCVLDNSGANDEKPVLQYLVSARRSFGAPVDKPDAKKKFVDMFVKWVAAKLPPYILETMNIDCTPTTAVQRSRKILQLAES